MSADCVAVVLSKVVSGVDMPCWRGLAAGDAGRSRVCTLVKRGLLAHKLLLLTLCLCLLLCCDACVCSQVWVLAP